MWSRSFPRTRSAIWPTSIRGWCARGGWLDSSYRGASTRSVRRKASSRPSATSRLGLDRDRHHGARKDGERNTCCALRKDRGHRAHHRCEERGRVLDQLLADVREIEETGESSHLPRAHTAL